MQFGILLGVLVSLWFWSVLAGKATWVARDFGLFSYPAAFFQKECFWRGELPLWNPYNCCGLPFLAQWNTMSLYPPTIIYLLFPLAWSLPFFCLAHLYWGGLGMCCLARSWTGNSRAAALAGLIFAFNGLSINFLMWPSHIATFSWLPWVLWLVPEGWRGSKHPLWAIGAGAMQMLSGAPETILFTWIILTALAVCEWAQTPKLRRRIAIWFPLTVLMVALVCAAQLVPFLELLLESQRDSGYASTSHNWSMPPWGWANFLVPLYRTSMTSGGIHLQNLQYWTSSYYAGVGTVFLALMAMAKVKERRVRLLGGAILAGLLLAWGDSTLLYKAFFGVFPLLGFIRYSIKFVVPVMALLPLLAAFGVDYNMSKGAGSPRVKWFILGALLLAIGLICASEWNAPEQVRKATLASGLSRAAFLVGGFFVLSQIGKLRSGNATAWTVLLAFIFWLDFKTHTTPQNPQVSSTVYAQEAGNAPTARAEPGNFQRVMINAQLRETLSQSPLDDPAANFRRNLTAGRVNANLLEHIPQVDGFYSLVPRRMLSLIENVCYEKHPDLQHLESFMGVSSVLKAGEHGLEWNRAIAPLPLITAGQQPAWTGDGDCLASLLSNEYDLSRTVFLPGEARSEIQAARQPEALVLKTDVSNRKISASVESPTRAMLIIAQTFYPGWVARVDGRQTKIWRANYAFEAVEVPAGHHRVELSYEAGSFRFGMVVSGLSLVCAALFLILKRIRVA
jgi:hypothetical protein